MQQKTLTSKEYVDGILRKDRILLSKAITIVESTHPNDEALAEAILQGCIEANKISKRIAVSGAPGVGKSTFLNAYGKLLLDEKKSLAILAIDPSSSVSKGSILGDKTRMEDLVNDANVFIRPTASSNHLGGVARSTRETILLCEAFGFDYIFVETVGVGQSETMAKNMTDLFLLLLLPNAGDELQGIKRGIMEMADIILVNKSEKENETAAKRSAAQIQLALHLYAAHEKDWATPVLNISSTEKTGLDELQKNIELYFLKMETSGFIQHNRTEQQLQWLDESVVHYIKSHFLADEDVRKKRTELEEQIKRNEIDAGKAAKLLAGQFRKKTKH